MNPKFTSVVLWCTALFFVYEVVGDILEGESFAHYFIEAVFFALVFSALLAGIYQARKYRAQISQHEVELGALKGKLAIIVQDQFKEWSLSKSESEVAWLIIKGFSFNEIAAIRSVAEKTVRQQASTIYKKSETSSRAEFTAEFLNDILHIEAA